MTPKQFKAAPAIPYSDWFGKGDDKKDYDAVVEERGEPLEILRSEYMLCLLYKGAVVVTGYDGNEYHHTFVFEREVE